MDNASLPIDPSECELKLERPSPNLATLTVRVPAALVKRFRKKMRKAGRDADAQELRSALVHFCMAHGFNDPEIRGVSTPGWLPGTTPPRASPDHDFEAVIAVDTAVPMTVPDASNFELEIPDAEVDDAMIEEEVAAQCRQMGKRVPAEAVSRGTECIVDVEYRLAREEQPVLTYQKAVVWVPLKGDAIAVAGTRIPGGVAALDGARALDRREMESTYPAGGALRYLRGAPALVTWVVREVRAVQPATVDHVLTEYGMPSEARLRTQIRFALEDKRERDSQAVLRQQLSEHLVRHFNPDLPTVRGAVGRAVAERSVRELISGRGLTGAAAEAELERLLPLAQARADFTSKLEFVIRSLARDIGVGMDEDIIAGRLAGAAAEAGVRPETLRAELVKTGQYKEYVERLFAELALDKLLLNAKPRRIPTAEWEARHSGAHAAS